MSVTAAVDVLAALRELSFAALHRSAWDTGRPASPPCPSNALEHHPLMV